MGFKLGSTDVRTLAVKYCLSSFYCPIFVHLMTAAKCAFSHVALGNIFDKKSLTSFRLTSLLVGVNNATLGIRK